MLLVGVCNLVQGSQVCLPLLALPFSPGVLLVLILLKGLPGGSDGKASAHNAGDPGSIPRLERSPGEGNGEGNGSPLQYSCLENSMDGGAWWATVHGVSKSRTQLSDFTFTSHLIESESVSCSVMSNSVTPWTIARRSPLSRNSPGENTRVGSHSLLWESSRPRNQTQVSSLQAASLPSEPRGKSCFL